jgi:hypothetical protein
MGCRQRADRALPLLLVGLIALAVHMPTAGAQPAGEAGPHGLWFTYRSFGDHPHVFTTFGPEPDALGWAEQGEPMGSFGLASHWTWRLPAAPAEWSVPAGTVWTLELWFSRLNEVVPVGDPFIDPMAQGRIRIGLEIAHDLVIATGAVYVDAQDAQAEPTLLRLEVTFPEARSFQVRHAQEQLVFRMTVTGRGVTDPTSPATFHYGAPATPASVDAPEYPVAALRSLEEEELRAQECARLLLEQQPCPEDVREDEPENHDAPMPGALLAMGVAGMVAAALRRNALSRSDRS